MVDSQNLKKDDICTSSFVAGDKDLFIYAIYQSVSVSVYTGWYLGALLTQLMQWMSQPKSQKCKSAHTHAARVRTRPRSASTPARMTISSNSLPFSYSGQQLRVMTSTIPAVVYYTTLILPGSYFLSVLETVKSHYQYFLRYRQWGSIIWSTI